MIEGRGYMWAVHEQRLSLSCAQGLVKFAPAVARLFCLVLPGSFLTMFAQNKGDLCIRTCHANYVSSSSST